MVEPLLWPYVTLKPTSILVDPVPFSRTGGRSLGGLQRVTRTDRGWWSIGYRGVSLNGVRQRRCWNAIRSRLRGMAGLVAIPVWSHDSAPWPAGAYYGDFASEHSDDAPFGDGSPYATPSIEVLLVDALEIGDTVATIEIVANIDELTGVRWSFEHALYENGPAIAIDGNQWTVEIQPAIRAPIPAGASLNVSRPTCLCRLATDREMDTSFTAGFFDRVDVAFVEAVDEWSNRAAAAAGS